MLARDGRSSATFLITVARVCVCAWYGLGEEGEERRRIKGDRGEKMQTFPWDGGGGLGNKLPVPVSAMTRGGVIFSTLVHLT